MSSGFDYWVPTPIDIVERRTRPGFVIPEQQRPFHHMLLVLSGKGTCQIEGGSFPMEEGMLIYHPYNQQFGYLASREKPLHYLGTNFSLASIHRDGEWKPDVTDSLPIGTYSMPANFDKLVRLFREMTVKWNRRVGNRFMLCRSMMLNLFVDLIQSGKPVSNRRNEETIKKIAYYMKKHHERSLTLPQLAALAEFSPSYFGSLFHTIMGETPIEYLHSIRIENAIEHMISGCSIQEAAARVGFEEPYYFSRVFKRKKGMSPSEFLKRSEGLI